MKEFTCWLPHDSLTNVEHQDRAETRSSTAIAAASSITHRSCPLHLVLWNRHTSQRDNAECCGPFLTCSVADGIRNGRACAANQCCACSSLPSDDRYDRLEDLASMLRRTIYCIGVSLHALPRKDTALAHSSKDLHLAWTSRLQPRHYAVRGSVFAAYIYAGYLQHEYLAAVLATTPRRNRKDEILKRLFNLCSGSECCSRLSSSDTYRAP